MTGVTVTIKQMENTRKVAVVVVIVVVVAAAVVVQYM